MIKDEWILLINNQMDGPFTTAQVAAKIAAGEVSFACVAWREGFNTWKRLGDLSEFDRRPARPVELKPTASQVASIDERQSMPSSDELIKSVFRREISSAPPVARVGFVEDERPAEAMGEDLIGPLPWMKKLSIAFLLFGGLQLVSLPLLAAPEDSPAVVQAAQKKFEVLGLAPIVVGKKTSLRFQASGFSENSLKTLRARLTARPGDLVGRLRYDRVFQKPRIESGLLIVDLGRERLSEGIYRLRIENSKDSSQTATGEFFVGERNGEFEKRLQAYLKSVSEQLQREKKALYYSAENLERLARETTASKDGKSREHLRKQVTNFDKQIASLSRNFRPDRSAFVEEYLDLRALSRALVLMLKEGKSSTGQNTAHRLVQRNRSIASTSDRDLVSEIQAFKMKIAELSLFNQTADSAVDREAAQSERTEKL